jgi:hypothetical protein
VKTGAQLVDDIVVVDQEFVHAEGEDDIAIRGIARHDKRRVPEPLVVMLLHRKAPLCDEHFSRVWVDRLINLVVLIDPRVSGCVENEVPLHQGALCPSLSVHTRPALVLRKVVALVRDPVLIRPGGRNQQPQGGHYAKQQSCRHRLVSFPGGRCTADLLATQSGKRWMLSFAWFPIVIVTNTADTTSVPHP